MKIRTTTRVLVGIIVVLAVLNILQLFYRAQVNVHPVKEPDWMAHNQPFYDAIEGCLGRPADIIDMLELAIEGKQMRLKREQENRSRKGKSI